LLGTTQAAALCMLSFLGIRVGHSAHEIWDGGFDNVEPSNGSPFVCLAAFAPVKLVCLSGNLPRQTPISNLVNVVDSNSPKLYI